MLDKTILEGAYDLHVHSAPDIVKRKADDILIAERITDAGMRGYVSKAHYGLTTDRVLGAQRMFPGCRAMGSITLNSTHGGINPVAAEHAARMGAKIIWFPTMDSPEEFSFIVEHAPDLVDMQLGLEKEGLKMKRIAALDSNGQLTAEAREIIAIARDYDIAVGTGHITHGETFALAEAAADMGFRKLIITHVNLSATRYTVGEQKRLAEMGAFIERSFVFPYSGRISWEEESEEIREAGVQSCILSTDLGRMEDPFTDEGMFQYARELHARGISEDMITQMIKINPARLVE